MSHWIPNAAYPGTAPVGTTAPEVAAAVRRAAAVLSALGHDISELAPPAMTLAEFLPMFQRLAANAPVFRPGVLQPVTRWLRSEGRRYRRADMLQVRDALAARVLSWCAGADVVLTPTVPVLPPRVGRGQVLQLLSGMRINRPPSAAGQATVLGDLLKTAAGIIQRRSLLFVVSDFISEPGWQDALARLARRHDVVAVRLWDPLEMALPDVGLVTVQDAETGEQLFIDASDPAFRARYAAAAEAQEALLQTTALQIGFELLLHTGGQRAPLPRPQFTELRIVLLHKLIEQRALGTMLRVAGSRSALSIDARWSR